MAIHERKDNKDRSGSSDKQIVSFLEDIVRRMEDCPTAESLNANVITPFATALSAVCDARGYVLNIYGEHTNIVVTPENHADSIYRLAETYLDDAGVV